ncbi:MAG TPA: PAS domain S-box protein, partial [Blastocatellia bacterium]|nr:PAS domain S-box protein [Blastocatellia bacterium]
MPDQSEQTLRSVRNQARLQEPVHLMATQSGETFRLLIESVKDYAIFILDSQGYISTWNAGAENIKGYKAEEIIGTHFSVFYPEEDLNWDKPGYELK